MPTERLLIRQQPRRWSRSVAPAGRTAPRAFEPRSPAGTRRSSSGLQVAQLRLSGFGPRGARRAGQLSRCTRNSSSWRMPSISSASVDSCISSRDRRLVGRLELERALRPAEHPERSPCAGRPSAVVDGGEVDLPLAQEDAADVRLRVGRDQHARLAAGRQELQQIGQRDLLDVARHRLGRRRGALVGGDRHLRRALLLADSCWSCRRRPRPA